MSTYPKSQIKSFISIVSDASMSISDPICQLKETSECLSIKIDLESLQMEPILAFPDGAIMKKEGTTLGNVYLITLDYV